MIDIPTLQAERLILRPIRPDDFDAVAAFFADPASSTYGGPCDRATAWRKFATYPGHWYLRGYGLWALEAKHDGHMVGLAGLWYPVGFPEPEITYAIWPGEHGNGYATEAALRSLNYAYQVAGWKTAVSCVHPRNTASAKVAMRIGAIVDGQAIVHGEPHDIYRYPPPHAIPAGTSTKMAKV